VTAKTKTAVSATILERADGWYTIAAWGAVGIVHWLRQADGPAMRAVSTNFEVLVEAHPRGVSFVHIVEEGAGLPDPDARRELSEMMSSFAGATVCVGVVLLGRGFWASAMQSLLTGLRLVAPPRPWTMRFATRTSELGTWLPAVHLQRTQQAVDANELEAVLEGVRALSAQRLRVATAR
jgi:hypothetical protein